MTNQTDQVMQVNKELFRYSGRNLSSGGEKTPLLEFKGRMTGWEPTQSPFNAKDFFIKLYFDQVQVDRLRPDSGPYPYDTVELSIKHSAAERSGFGFLIASMNQAIGVSKDESDMDLYIHKTWHMNTERYNWGNIPGSSVADAEGNTWGEIWLGEIANSVSPTVAASTPSAILPPSGTAGTTALTADQVALQTLNGKNKADWLREVVNNTTVQRDANVLMSIVSDQYLAAKVLDGQVTENPDGTFTVTNA